MTRRGRWRLAWLHAALIVAGCILAAWLGARGGRYYQLATEDLRPAPSPHIYVSGPTYLDAAVQGPALTPVEPAGV